MSEQSRSDRGRTPRALLAAWVLLIAALLTAAGCTPLHYLAQAGAGQLDITMRTESLGDAITNPRTPPRVRELLLRVPAIKQFGERNGLTPTSNYGTYADLERSAAVWVVSACAPLQFRAKTWSFPIIGSVPYLGWFDKESAREFAAELAADGWDVDVRKAAAYSTLGWFEDPVLSTMIPDGDEALGALANTLLHESVHATFYIKGQSILNESTANLIGDVLAERYLDETAGRDSVEKQAYVEAERRGALRATRLHAAYRDLEHLYASPRPANEKLVEKRRLLAEIRRELDLARPLSNASLIQFRTYNAGTAPLKALFTACGGEIRRMLAALARLGPDDFSRPQQEDLASVILPLTRAGCR